MKLDFSFDRTVITFCASLLFTVTCVSAAEVGSQAKNETLVSEKLAPRTGPESVVVEGVGVYGVNTESVSRHLANSLAANSALPSRPRANERYSFDGKLRTYVVPVRPAIDNPVNRYSPYDSSSFRRDTVTADASNLGLLQAVFKRLVAD